MSRLLFLGGKGHTPLPPLACHSANLGSRSRMPLSQLGQLRSHANSNLLKTAARTYQTLSHSSPLSTTYLLINTLTCRQRLPSHCLCARWRQFLVFCWKNINIKRKISAVCCLIDIFGFRPSWRGHRDRWLIIRPIHCISIQMHFPDLEVGALRRLVSTSYYKQV